MSKKCCACGKTKPVSEFWRHSQLKSGHHSRCKDCQRPLQRKYKIKNQYGLESEDHLSQSCEICGSTERLNIDHNHETGGVRGRLCWNCNIAIGYMHDDPERLEKAAAYLRRA